METSDSATSRAAVSKAFASRGLVLRTPEHEERRRELRPGLDSTSLLGAELSGEKGFFRIGRGGRREHDRSSLTASTAHEEHRR